MYSDSTSSVKIPFLFIMDFFWLINVGQVDYAETTETAESAEILLSLPNQTFTSHYNLCPLC